MSIVLGIFTFILILVSLLLILVVLMQKSQSGAGLGSALGGGMTESAFGAESNNVLTKWTRNLTILFFVLSFALYLGHIYVRKHAAMDGGNLPSIVVPATAGAADAATDSKPAPAADASAVELPVAPVTADAPVGEPAPQK